jgi:anhydro-N-acetylmuramic acid kinase
MNKNLAHLYEIFQKKERLVIGLMSGTSLDGLDVALCRIKNSGLQTKVEVLHFETFSYTSDYKNDVREIFAKRQVDLEKVCILNALTGRLHAELVLSCLKKWNISPEAVDCIASHGQTIYHAPERLHRLKNYPNSTLQIGDGDHIAVTTGILTISDFRQKHIAAGGEGAPLALYGDYLMFTSMLENRILLNIGGISNFTFLPADGDPGRIISTDVGPGNTLIDSLTQKHFNKPFDKDGQIAKKGNVSLPLLKAMLNHSFFSEPFPKTCGPELFNFQFIDEAQRKSGISEISGQDLIATVTELTAQSIIRALSRYDGLELTIYGSGGGNSNPSIIDQLKTRPNTRVKSTRELGIDPDAKEAVLFAVLANETLSDSSTQIGDAPAVAMGKISLPR